ncbi:GNAT family N-acetyltransferase [Nonomuraea sp. NPDC050404]|uniref:GNAT family N-acetyltransferase n=1 Tax=Nonomuraea sp. NPDC050404 TaxID=3155783 RepID=UPI0033DB2BC3
MQWGPLTRQDARPLADLWAEVEAEDRAGEIHNADDMAEHLAGQLIDLAGGTLAARDGDRIVAFGYLPARQSADSGVHVMRLWGGVHPAHRRRGHGRRIVDWAVGVAPGLGEKAFPGVPVEVHLGAYDGNPGVGALARAAGFVPARSFAVMERSLRGDLPVHRTPEGMSIVTWTPELNDGARHVRNESFRDHWGSVPHTRESWAAHTTGSRNFRPDSSFVVLSEENRPVGLLTTHSYDPRQAKILIVGTLKEWRGRGVAGALMAHALATFARQGYERAALTVDPDNPTGAVGVYERAGFTITRRSTNYVLALPQRKPGDEPGVGVHE